MVLMRPLRRVSAWIPALAGVSLIALASRSGLAAGLLAVVPGALMLSGGVRGLLEPDMRAPAHAAVGAVLGLLLTLPLGLLGGGILGVTALTASAAAFVAAGWLGIRLEPPLADVPAPPPSIAYGTRVALDDAMLSVMTWMQPPPSAAAVRDAVRESETAHALLTGRGWIEKPESFHVVPPAVDAVESSSLHIRGVDCEHIRFESGFEPHADLPGRDRWLSYRENRTCHAWIVRRREPGPWLVCVHGAGMGTPEMGIPAFRVQELHQRAGLNLALIALPVHGPRSSSRFSGADFLGLSPLDLVHAESQSVWDLRRLIGWLRAQEATQIGVLGISLGGYTTALLAGLEDGLACVIAGAPPSDLIATNEYLASSLEQRALQAAGMDAARDRAIHRVVSPLAVSPRPGRDRRFIFAATGDHFVPMTQVRALWNHWDRPRISWCTGGHVSALMQREPRRLIDEAIAASLGAAASPS